jgi:hypothetical protein
MLMYAHVCSRMLTYGDVCRLGRLVESRDTGGWGGGDTLQGGGRLPHAQTGAGEGDGERERREWLGEAERERLYLERERACERVRAESESESESESERALVHLLADLYKSACFPGTKVPILKQQAASGWERHCACLYSIFEGRIHS